MTKSTFLDQPEWMTVPFLVKPKQPLDNFIDIFLEGFKLLAEGDNIGKMPPHLQFARGIELLKGCWKFDNDMEEFYRELKTSRGPDNPVFWPVLCAEEEDSGHSDTLATTTFEFADIGVALPMMLYWASLTVVWSGMTDLYNMVDSFVEQFNPVSIPNMPSVSKRNPVYEKLGIPERGHCGDFIVTARKVCQSVAYCMRHELGRRAAVAPLVMVRDTLLSSSPKYDETIDWIEARLVEIQSDGMNIAKYLPIQGRELPPAEVVEL
jgi:hypothetical protein